MGQRYIASGLSGKDITIEGTPGNALGAYLDGSTITVHGNVQDATGDTMNDGAIYVDGQAETPQAMPCGVEKSLSMAMSVTGLAST